MNIYIDKHRLPDFINYQPTLQKEIAARHRCSNITVQSFKFILTVPNHPDWYLCAVNNTDVFLHESEFKQPAKTITEPNYLLEWLDSRLK